MTLVSRPLTAADLPAAAELHAAFDRRWFGQPENDLAEVTQSFERAQDSLLVLDDDGEPVLVAWWASPTEPLLVGTDSPAAYDLALPWFAEAGVQVDALAQDAVLAAALQRHGFGYLRSSYELLRPAEGLAAPVWPDDVRVTSLGGDAERVWDLVYHRCGWTEVPGHGHRPYDEWTKTFLSAEVDPEQQVLAWVGDDLAGVAIGKTFSDGSGWIAQLAVAHEHKGRGLGRALILEAFRHRVAGGATQLGLGVSADNPDALRLYLSVGLEIDREWRHFAPPS